jgi:putative Ca2+/H+ antiporter (TMEM165/GDT1 family)
LETRRSFSRSCSPPLPRTHPDHARHSRRDPRQPRHRRVLRWAASDILSGDTLRWILAVSFFAMAIWTLQTDKLDKPPETFDKLGAFLATLIAFFIIEIGDKTQVATMALAAHYQSIVLVTIGTTLGMMIANVPAVYLGEMAARKLPLVWMRRIAAAILFLMAIAAALNIGQLF